MVQCDSLHVVMVVLFVLQSRFLIGRLINGGKGTYAEKTQTLLAEEAVSGEIEGNMAAGLDDHPIAGQDHRNKSR